MMRNLWGFKTEQVGLMYFTTCIGAVFGLCGGQIQEHLYRKKAPTRGIEARLYAPMAAGILFSIGCFITGFTALPNIHWIGSAVGQVIVISKWHCGTLPASPPPPPPPPPPLVLS